MLIETLKKVNFKTDFFKFLTSLKTFPNRNFNNEMIEKHFEMFSYN